MNAARTAEEQQRRLENEAAANLVRSRDRERYWSTLFAPAARRPGLLALYAFNAELEHIAAIIREPMVGQIRLQWWRDAIDLAAPGTRTGNPAADALASAMLEYDLPKQRLTGMIDGRIPEISGEAFTNMHAFRSSLEETEGAIFELAALMLGDRSEAAHAAAKEAALAYGLMRRLRTIPLQASRRRFLIPPAYFDERAASAGALYAGRGGAAFGAALADLRGEASRALQRFRELAPRLNRAVLPAFLPLTLVRPYLKAMAAPSHDPLRATVTLNPARSFWRIWRGALRGSI